MMISRSIRRSYDPTDSLNIRSDGACDSVAATELPGRFGLRERKNQVKLDASKLERLLEVGRNLVAEREPDEVLIAVLNAARELTGAQYAAMGILDPSGSELARFLTVGIDEDMRRRIGPLPRGHGILGEL